MRKEQKGVMNRTYYSSPSSYMSKNRNMNDINCVPYFAEVLLVHLDLSDIRGVVGCMDLVLLLVVHLPIQTLGKGRR